MAYDLASGKRSKRDWSCGIAEVGSFLTPTSVLNKIDDVRYDVRRVGANVAAGIFALAGTFAFLAFAKMYKVAETRKVA